MLKTDRTGRVSEDNRQTGGLFVAPIKGRLEIGKSAPMVPTYLVLSGKKSAISPPAEIFNSKNHAKTNEPPF